MSNIIQRFRKWYRSLPDKKRYLEFVTASLSVPVLITVLLTNVGNLKGRSQTQQPSPTPIVVTVSKDLTNEKPAEPTQSNPPQSPTIISECKKEVGPIELLHPLEGEVVTGEPLSIDLSYKIGEYCAVVWSYRLNAGKWSDFTDKSIELYGVPAGEKSLEIRIKSIISNDSKTLNRKFTVETSTTSDPATDSAQIK